MHCPTHRDQGAPVHPLSTHHPPPAPPLLPRLACPYFPQQDGRTLFTQRRRRGKPSSCKPYSGTPVSGQGRRTRYVALGDDRRDAGCSNR